MNLENSEPPNKCQPYRASDQSLNSNKKPGGEDCPKDDLSKNFIQLTESEVYSLLSNISDQPSSFDQPSREDNFRKDEITQSYLDRSNEFTQLLKSSEVKDALHTAASMSIWIEINRDNRNHKVALLHKDQTVRAWNSINRYRKYSNPSKRPFGTSLFISLISRLLRVVFGNSDPRSDLNTAALKETIKIPIYILYIYNRNKLIDRNPVYECVFSVFPGYSYIADIKFFEIGSRHLSILTQRSKNKIERSR